MKKKDCFCGQKKNYVEVRSIIFPQSINVSWKTNIIGGDFAEKNEFPWAALINLTYTELGQTYRCGGSLINDRSVSQSDSKLSRALQNNLCYQVHCDGRPLFETIFP